MLEISLLWMLFSVVGLIVLGIGPASAAACATTRKFVLGSEVPIFRTFFSTYRAEFVRSNQIAWILMAVGIILAWDTRIALHARSPLLHLTFIPMVLIDGVCTAVALHVFPLYAHRDMPKLLQYFQLAGITALLNPRRSLVMLGLLYVWLFVLGGLLPFLGIGLLAYWLVRLTISGNERVVHVVLNTKTSYVSGQ